MTRRAAHLILSFWLMSFGNAAIGQDASTLNSKAKQAPKTPVKTDAEQGQQVFANNCSRCHKAPETIPSSISGTVALHMRVRAGLSKKDYERLLAFLNQ